VSGGEIKRVEYEEYEFQVPRTRKKLKFTHRFQFNAIPVVLEIIAVQVALLIETYQSI
jgi:hypothetical protein